MRLDFRADAILQRRNDLSARRVVFRVGGEDEHDIQRKAHRITLNLHVAFLHDVEQADLDLAGQIRQFIDREDAAIRARQQSVVNGEFAAERVAAFGGFDGIDVADDVGNRHVGRGKLLDIAFVAGTPDNRRCVSLFFDQVAALAADRERKGCR